MTGWLRHGARLDATAVILGIGAVMVVLSLAMAAITPGRDPGSPTAPSSTPDGGPTATTPPTRVTRCLDNTFC